MLLALVSRLGTWAVISLPTNQSTCCHFLFTLSQLKVSLAREEAHTAVVFFFWASRWNHCLAALDIGAGVERPFNCLIVQNLQAMQSMGRSMDWTLEDDMVDGLFFCATLTGRRGGHTSFVQAGAETSDTGAEAVKPDPGSFWDGRSGCVCTGVWN